MILTRIDRVIDYIVKAILIMIPVAVVTIAILTLLGPATGGGVYSSLLITEDLKPTVKGLSAAEARWNSHLVSDYDVTVTVICYPNSVTPTLLNVRVRHSVVQNTDEILKAFPTRTDCGARKWLPGTSFTTLRQTFRGFHSWRYEVEFDPTYGYVSSFSSHPQGEGIGTSIVLSDFQPVEP